MLIPDNVIDEIRSRADIVDIVSDYLALIPAGRNYKALSPFTQEKTPSFIVSPEKQIYKCFSTGKGGNAFTFLMEMENIGFIDAVKLVAQKAGVDLSAYEKKTHGKVLAPEENEDHALLAWAARQYHHNLLEPVGKECLEYLENRGIRQDTIVKFGLGFSLNGWENLSSKARDEKLNIEKLQELGLLSKSKKHHSHFDTFRARLMFPIFSTTGKVVGFGGRILTAQQDTPKYINSPESKVYDKSRLLYAMNFAGQEIRRKQNAILVEGYMDAIALHQAGIINTVATSGTALTPEQAKLLKRYSKMVTFIYDGDKAGLNAMMRGIDVLITEGLHIAVGILPEGEDPDSFIRRVGKEEFQQFVSNNQQSFLEFKLSRMEQNQGFETAEATAKSIRDMLGTLAKIPDELERETHLKNLSDKLDVSLGLLQKELYHIISGARKPKREFKNSQGAPLHQAGEATQNDLFQEQRPTVLEATFIKALLESTYHGYQVLEFVEHHKELFSPQHPWIQTTLAFLIERYHITIKSQKENASKVILAQELDLLKDEPLQNYLSALLISDPISEKWPAETPQEYAHRCLKEFIDAAVKMNLEQFTIIKSGILEELNQIQGTNQEIDILKKLQDIQKKELQAKKVLDEELKIFVQVGFKK